MTYRARASSPATKRISSRARRRSTARSASARSSGSSSSPKSCVLFSAVILSVIIRRHDRAGSQPLSSRAESERCADQKGQRVDDLQNSGARQIHFRLRREHPPESPDQGRREGDEREESQTPCEDQGGQRDDKKRMVEGATPPRLPLLRLLTRVEAVKPQ